MTAAERADDEGVPYDPDPLRVGERVRVRLSGEMPLDAWLPPTFDGAVGVVHGEDSQSDLPYSYAVRMDGRAGLTWFARVELSRIP